MIFHIWKVYLLQPYISWNNLLIRSPNAHQFGNSWATHSSNESTPSLAAFSAFHSSMKSLRNCGINILIKSPRKPPTTSDYDSLAWESHAFMKLKLKTDAWITEAITTRRKSFCIFVFEIEIYYCVNINQTFYIIFFIIKFIIHFSRKSIKFWTTFLTPNKNKNQIL